MRPLVDCVHLGFVSLRCLIASLSTACSGLMSVRSFSESMVMLAQSAGVIRDVALSDSMSCVEVNIGLKFCGFTVS